MVNKEREINILVTLDENYIPYLNVMLSSMLQSNPGRRFNVYLLHTSIRPTALENTRRLLEGAGELIPIAAKDIGLSNAPTTSRYPLEIYYRIFAAKYLPDTLDRVLYLDPDLIVNRSLEALWSMPLDDYYFAAASHTGKLITKLNGIRLDMDEEAPYINSGVMLMNLKKLREEQDLDDVFRFIEERGNLLILPDQDIISSLYGSKILALDSFRYNMTELLYMQHAPFERELDMNWIRNHAVIIHYCGRNKPWKPNYIGQLDIFYHEAEENLKNLMRDKSEEAQNA